MVTTARHYARSVSLVVLMLFVAGPGWVWAEPRPGPGTAGAVALRPSEAVLSPGVASAQSLGALAGIPDDLSPPSGSRPAGQSPQWFGTNAGGSWWSRRTTAQKTWFIVGLVVGAYGVYAVASNGSKSHSGGGGGGGGY